MSAAKVYWNGEPAQGERGFVTVPEHVEGDPPEAWWKPIVGRTEPVGNAAGTGACQIALDERAFLRATQLARTTEHLELSGHPAFEDTFVDMLAFPEDRL